MRLKILVAMDKRLLETILYDQAEELVEKNKIHFVKRLAEDKIDLDSPQAQVVIGVRRCGKSTLCYNALHRSGVKFAYVNLDDEHLLKLNADDLNDVLEVLYKINGDFKYLFIDEIQNIPEWYLFVNRLLRRGIHLVITGSNAKLLSGELATHLSGRHHPITLYPFSFEEYCEFKAINTQSPSTRDTAFRRSAFDKYMNTGGFPELYFIQHRKDYISSLVDNILKNDIERRFKILYKASFERMAHHMLNDTPCIVSEKRLQEIFDFKSPHTVKNYMDYLREAFLLLGLQKFSYKSRLRVTGEKIYPIDVSLMDFRDNSLAGKNLGARLETIVYLELLRRYKSAGYDIFYYNDRQAECDFIVGRGTNMEMAIQVSYDISSPKTRKREIQGLLHGAHKTGATRLLLLTDHEYSDIEVGGHHIEIRPVYDYVL